MLSCENSHVEQIDMSKNQRTIKSTAKAGKKNDKKADGEAEKKDQKRQPDAPEDLRVSKKPRLKEEQAQLSHAAALVELKSIYNV